MRNSDKILERLSKEKKKKMRSEKALGFLG